jgi:hypothetical protein
VSEWGHDFRPAYLGLEAVRADFPGVPLIAATATATADVRASIASARLRRCLGGHLGSESVCGYAVLRCLSLTHPWWAVSRVGCVR